MERREEHLNQIRGIAARWIARPYCSLDTAAKTLRTLIAKYALTEFEIEKTFFRVREETVTPFYNEPWNSGTDRASRFDELVAALERAVSS